MADWEDKKEWFGRIAEWCFGLAFLAYCGFQIYFIWFQEAEYTHNKFWFPALLLGGTALGLTTIIWIVAALFSSKTFWKVVGVLFGIVLILAVIGGIQNSNQEKLEKQNIKLINEIEDEFLQLKTLYSVKDNDDDLYLKKEKDITKLIQKVKNTFAEQFTLVENNTFDLQENILNIMMLPIELILGSLPKMVEETAMHLDKEIKLSITGMEVMLDKSILEKINDPIIHLVRNAIDHGIEMPKDREKAGKSREGQINISCYSESGNIIIKIKDDGKGIDYEKVKKRVLDMNPGLEDEVNSLKKPELLQYLFMPGFSTSSKVTDLSGRGVGLDIVKFNVEKVKGKISINSEEGQGSEFLLVLPLSLATVSGFFITSSKKKFFFPSNFIQEMVIINKKDEIKLVNKRVFKLRDKIVPLHRLSDLFLLEEEHVEKKEIFVAVAESMGEMIGIEVDSVIEYTTLIYKPLPKRLMPLKSVQGIVFDEDYNIINILYIPSLIEKFKSLRNIDLKKRFVKTKKRYKKILVIDDSLNAREIERQMLEAESYLVETAEDGIEGLDKVKEKNFDLIVTDINMPRMNGLTFIENLRMDEKNKLIPVIIVSSVHKDGDKEKAKTFGANDYIVKSQFDQNNLINSVMKLIGKAEK